GAAALCTSTKCTFGHLSTRAELSGARRGPGARGPRRRRNLVKGAASTRLLGARRVPLRAELSARAEAQALEALGRRRLRVRPGVDFATGAAALCTSTKCTFGHLSTRAELSVRAEAQAPGALGDVDDLAPCAELEALWWRRLRHGRPLRAGGCHDSGAELA